MALRSFARSSDDRVVAGVCAGIAQTLGVDPTLIRLIFAILALQFPNSGFRTPASTSISFVRDTPLDLAFAGPLIGVVLFVTAFGLIASGAVTAVGLTLFLTAPTSKISELDDRADLEPKLRAIVPVVGPGAFGVHLQGTF